MRQSRHKTAYTSGVLTSCPFQPAARCTLAGLPLPEIEDAGGCVTVRFRRSRYLPPQRVGRDVTERQQAILALLDQAGEGLALREILSWLEMPASERQVREDLAILRTLGLALPEGHGRGAHWRRL